MEKIRFPLLLLLLVSLAFAIRLYHLDFQSLWRDEVDAILFAEKGPLGLLPWFITPGQNGPLYYLLLSFWITIVGRGEFGVRFFSLFWGVLLVPLIYQVGLRWLERRVALFATLLVSLSPYLIWYSQEAKMYSLLSFLSLLSVHLYLLALERNRWYLWLAYLLATGLSMYIHILAVLLVPFEALFYLISWPRYRGASKAWLMAMGILVLPYLPLARWEIPTLLSSFATGHKFYTLPEIFTVLLFSFGLNSAPYRGLFPVALVLFLLLAGVLLYRKEGEGGEVSLGGFLALLRNILAKHHSALFLSLYLFVPLFALYLISLGMPIFTDRYLISITPAFFLLIGCGLVAIGKRSRLLLAICLALLLVVNLSTLWFQTDTKVKSDFRSVAEYMRDREGLIVFLMPYVRQSFAYYYQGDFMWADPPYTNGGLDEEGVGEEMEKITAGQEMVWLLVSEGELWDSRGLVREWLEENGSLVDEVEFARVEIYRYSLGGGH